MISVPTVSLFPECRGVFLRQVKSSSVSTLPHRNLNETQTQTASPWPSGPRGGSSCLFNPAVRHFSSAVVRPPWPSSGSWLPRGPCACDSSFLRCLLPRPLIPRLPQRLPTFKPTFLCWSAARCGTTALPHLLVYCRPPFSKTGRFSRAGSTLVILRALLQDTYRAPTQSWSSVGVHRTNKQVPNKLGNCEVHMVETKDSKRNRTYIAHVDETGWEEWS